MVTKQGSIENVRKTTFGENTFESFAKNCSLPTRNLDRGNPGRVPGEFAICANPRLDPGWPEDDINSELQGNIMRNY
jgi:hypothetical protein